MYIRKTKDVWRIIWQGEIVDETDTRKDAIYLRNEYNLAYGGGCTIKRGRERL